MAKKVEPPPETPGAWAFLHGTAAGVGSIAMWEVMAQATTKGPAIIVSIGASLVLFMGVVLHNRATINRAAHRCPKCKRPLPKRSHK